MITIAGMIVLNDIQFKYRYADVCFGKLWLTFFFLYDFL